MGTGFVARVGISVTGSHLRRGIANALGAKAQHTAQAARYPFGAVNAQTTRGGGAARCSDAQQ